MRHLVVLLNHEVVGILEQGNSGQRSFRYVEGAPAGHELSLALPFRLAAYSQAKTDPFIEGLLPEGYGVREALAKQFQVSPANPFGLLERIGLDCAGAVQFVRAEELKTVMQGGGELRPLPDVEIGRRLRSLISEPQGSWMVDRERWSLAGAQSKIALRWEDGWFEATGSEPTTHILKPGIADFRNQALNEHLCLRTLGKVGLSVAKTQYQEFDGTPAIVIERYDRFRHDGQVARIHQEDFCQATSTLPRRKYESDKGPGALKIINTLREAGAAEHEIDRFVDGLVANYLLGAPDAHAKNYSIILAPGVIAMAPLYDVASALPDEHVAKDGLRKAAMSIGGERTFGRIARRHWQRFAHDARIDGTALMDRVRALATAIPAALSGIIEEEQQAITGSELPKRLLEPVARLCGTALTLLDQ